MGDLLKSFTFSLHGIWWNAVRMTSIKHSINRRDLLHGDFQLEYEQT